MLRRDLGLELRAEEPAGEVRHVLTHRVLEIAAARVEAAGEPRPAGSYTAAGWFDPAEPGVGLSALARRLLALLPAAG